LDLRIMVWEIRSFTEKSKGSNSTEHQLSLVIFCIEIKLEIRDGV
jgi:hypothetical protein